ncbi:UDP-N-acetylmuramoyl-L-alanyl-D-glutamate--2,6-diaminopimelate ligase [Hufsiella ginkgonis]|uniref:UDP-N-acetylmuramoyl-L-alanyl-D-glutamate--2,6-diaminopimelate ligase n=1 Tax=Hufsiella ginkgonis TaxID=2695274 RepID=A0A7K1XSI1_9SPHI|nr:UDP-N-acetylmuramoyl-L-alanyl-D-glutamate--2,6-diaminopimelate ligase [Hufsiella ginkgonis]MXV13848.1 UDP-N-acetylmuramoyl-L-alanyl-D-glutamate--2,6-diaminopimelate ligase [Hufsiella ginkgonis]
MTSLKNILTHVNITGTVGKEPRTVKDICFDSRLAAPGSLFVAVRGTVTDGHKFIARVVEQGAAVVVCETFPEAFADHVYYVRTPDSSNALGILASAFFDNPSAKLSLTGVTGTNGKTTIATLLFKLFRELGYKVGLISTVQNQVNDRIIPATHTTPDPIALNRLLAGMVESGCDYCFMEVSSHAVAQNRIKGLLFSGGIFSNLTHDHLDFHGTFDAYLKAKKAFFDGLTGNAFALTNADDKNGAVMLQNTKAHRKSYGLKNIADFRAKIIENHFSGLLLNLDGAEVWFKLVGSFNAYNLLAVFSAAMLLEQDKIRVLTALSRLTGAEGRFDYVTGNSGITGIVDYAHTPDAVQNVLNTVHDIRKGNEQIITVIGCGGDRDKTKRPIMARTAGQWSDKVILTSDNPRSEDPAQIIRDMESGISPEHKRKYLSIADRKEAIRTACHLAAPGDIIVLAGKGHEKYQEISGVKYPFDDKQVLTEQLNQLN